MDLHPFYSTQRMVSVNANDLATLRQHGLCIISTEGFTFSSTDSHQDIDDKLRELFPAIFQWFDPLLHYPSCSQWPICSKHCHHKKGVMVNSDDRKLPDGADIIAACQVGTGKVNFMDLTLFLGMSIFFIIYQCKLTLHLQLLDKRFQQRQSSPGTFRRNTTIVLIQMKMVKTLPGLTNLLLGPLLATFTFCVHDQGSHLRTLTWILLAFLATPVCYHLTK